MLNIACSVLDDHWHPLLGAKAQLRRNILARLYPGKIGSRQNIRAMLNDELREQNAHSYSAHSGNVLIFKSQDIAFTGDFERSLRLLGTFQPLEENNPSLEEERVQHRISLQRAKLLRCWGKLEESETILKELTATSNITPSLQSNIILPLSMVQCELGKIDDACGLVRADLDTEWLKPPYLIQTRRLLLAHAQVQFSKGLHILKTRETDFEVARDLLREAKSNYGILVTEYERVTTPNYVELKNYVSALIGIAMIAHVEVLHGQSATFHNALSSWEYARKKVEQISQEFIWDITYLQVVILGSMSKLLDKLGYHMKAAAYMQTAKRKHVETGDQNYWFYLFLWLETYGKLEL